MDGKFVAGKQPFCEYFTTEISKYYYISGVFCRFLFVCFFSSKKNIYQYTIDLNCVWNTVDIQGLGARDAFCHLSYTRFFSVPTL